MLNVQVPLLHITAARIELVETVAKVVGCQQWISSARECPWGQPGDAALLKKWGGKNTQTLEQVIERQSVIDAICTTDNRQSVSKRIPGEPDAGCEVFVSRI